MTRTWPRPGRCSQGQLHGQQRCCGGGQRNQPAAHDGQTPTDKATGQFSSQTQPIGDRLALVSLVIKYRASWEVYVTGEGLWIAQGKTRSNCCCRFEADSARHLEQKISVI
jgi:hypothetical protein